MPDKKLLICTIAIDGIPEFIQDKSTLESITKSGHEVIVLTSHGTNNLLDSQGDIQLGLTQLECFDIESNVIQTLNQAINQKLDWHKRDLLIINNANCLITPNALEMMISHMYSFDRYAFGNPRMNIKGWTNLEAEDTSFAQTSLPKITRTPYPLSTCTYIKGRHLAFFGPLDDTFLSLDASLYDYALRANRYGYDSVMLNHVFVNTNNWSEPTVNKLDDLSAFDKQKLKSRYPYIEDLIERFLYSGIDPVDRFKGIILRSGNRKPRILLDFSNMPAVHCGTSEYQLGLIRYLNKYHADKYDIHVFASEEGAAFHNLQNFTDNIFFKDEDLSEYDIGIYAAQPTQVWRQIVADQHCARMIYTMLDSILLRCAYMNFSFSDSVDAVESVRCGLAYSDGIITISDYSKHDMLDYFQNDSDICSKPIKSIYIASDFGDGLLDKEPTSLKKVAPFDEYILLAGNPWFNHKALSDAIEVLKSTDHNYVVIGYGSDDYIYPNVYGLSYGYISDEDLFELYRSCIAFVFPSVYEGFGLPIVNALKCRKKVVANNNPLNKELIEHLGAKGEDIILFDTFEELPEAVDRAIASDAAPIDYVDTWEYFVDKLCLFVDEILKQPLDFEKLRSRHRNYTLHKQRLDRTHLEIEEAKHETPLRLLMKERAFNNHIENHPERLAIWNRMKASLKSH